MAKKSTDFAKIFIKIFLKKRLTGVEMRDIILVK